MRRFRSVHLALREGERLNVLQIIHRDYKSQRCQCFQWWQRTLPHSLIQMTWKTTAAAIKAFAIKERINKCTERKSRGSSLNTSGGSQSHLKDLMPVLLLLYLLVSILCSQLSDSLIPFMSSLCLSHWILIVIVLLVSKALSQTLEKRFLLCASWWRTT